MKRYLISSKNNCSNFYQVDKLDISYYRGWAEQEINIIDTKEGMQVTGIEGQSFIWKSIEEIKEWS